MESIASLNLTLAWILFTLGTVGGLGLGLFFHREEWMGGYASHRRRLYRLGHISLFGLGLLNLAFFVSAQSLRAPTPWLEAGSWAIAAGAVTMPVCCLLTAHRVGLRLLFAVPVSCVFAACALMVRELWLQ